MTAGGAWRPECLRHLRQAVKWSVQQNANALGTCRHFVAMLGDKPRDERRRDGTSVTVLRYETGTTMTRRGGPRLTVAIF